MVKKSALALCSVALLAAACALPASAQDARGQAPLQAHGKFTQVTPNREVTPPANVTIFSNFGTDPLQVWQANGWLILGDTSPSFGTSQDIAQPFTTKATAVHAKRTEVPVQQYVLGDGGTNGFEISLNNDAAGLPGGALAGSTKQAVANTAFPACCAAANAVTVAYGGLGIALAANTNYWVVVDTMPAGDTLTENVWCFNQTTNYAFSVGANPAVWNGPVGASQAPAAKVTGTNP